MHNYYISSTRAHQYHNTKHIGSDFFKKSFTLCQRKTQPNS